VPRKASGPGRRDDAPGPDAVDQARQQISRDATTTELANQAPLTANVLGVDLGISGALALVSRDGALLEVDDMPVTREANGRSATNAPLLAPIVARSHARIAFCEFVGARPTDAKVAAFAFGRARGVIEGSAGALSIPIVFLTPSV